MRKISLGPAIRGFAAVLSTTVTLSVPASAQTQDVTPPALQGFSFTPTAIEVTGGDQTVTVTVHFTDDLSGISSGCARFRSPSGQQYRYACFNDPDSRTSGDNKDGVYQGSAVFPQFSDAGTWHTDVVYAYDRIGNSKFSYEVDLTAAGFATTFEVTATPDILPPALQGFVLAPTTIDVSGGDQTVGVTVHFTDDLSGISSGCARFRSPSGQQYRYACFNDPDSRMSGDNKDGVYQSSAIFPQFSEAGTWHTDVVYAYDRIGNSKFSYEVDLIAAGFPTTLDVASNPSDTAAPVLISFGFSPDIIQTATSSGSVGITLHITDDLSGISSGCARFRSPSGQQYRYACFNDPDSRTSGNNKDGVYQGSADFPQFSEAGTWHTDAVYAYDRIGNSRFSYEIDLIAAGFPTTLQVSTSQPPVANAGPDQIVEATAPLTSVTLNGSASSDPEGDSLSFEWRDGAGTVVGTTAVVLVAVPLGTQVFTLTVNDGHANTASDSVAVTAVDTTAPTIAVVRPNGGEKLLTGSAYTIEWTAADAGGVSSFSVFVSTNGGGTFNPVPGCGAIGGALRRCVWSAPGPTTSAGRILVVATDSSGHTGTDGSDASFTIAAGTGSITLTAPNTAVDWGVGSTQPIKWSHNLGAQSYVRIELSRDAGETWETLASSFKNTAAASGVFNWVATGPTVEDVARIRVSGVNVAASDLGNASFLISMPYVAATTPATTSTNFGYGSARKQTWTTNLGPLDKVDVVLSTDGGATFPLLLASNVTATTKTANFTTPALGAPTAAARIGVLWTNGATAIGINPVNIRMEPSYIKVTSPNLSGEVWTVGSTPTLTWASNLGPSENVRIDLSLDGGATYPIVVSGGTPSDGAESVSVQPAWVTNNARVRMTWVRDPAVSDVSYQSFVIR